jgi:hypothetical protein
MKNVFRSLAVSLLFLPAGCNKTLDFGTFNFSDVSFVSVSGTIESGDGVAAIKEFRLVLDGTTLQDTVLTAPAARLDISGTKYGSGDGDHRLSLVVADQTTTPNLYVVNGITVVYHVSSSDVRKVTLGPQTAQLRTGDSISYAFKL